MTVEDLYSLVTDAIRQAESLEAEGKIAEAAAEFFWVSKLEEEIAKRLGPRDVYLRDPETNASAKVYAFIDPSADLSYVRTEALEQLEELLGHPLEEQVVQEASEDGKVKEIKTVPLLISFRDDGDAVYEFAYRGPVRVARGAWEWGDEEMLLGRDVLNKLVFTFDGANQCMTLEDPEPKV